MAMAGASVEIFVHLAAEAGADPVIGFSRHGLTPFVLARPRTGILVLEPFRKQKHDRRLAQEPAQVRSSSIFAVVVVL